MLGKEAFLRSRSRKECCCGTRMYAVRDFDFVYKQVKSVHLPETKKNLLLSRYVHIMEKIKHQFGCFSAWFTCSKTSLIIGNITIPSIMSIQALMNEDATSRTVLFWVVWSLSVIIAIISSIMTFCSTQKKYNLFNQFNTKMQRELWAYLTLTGRYRIRIKHKRAIEQFHLMERRRKESLSMEDDPVSRARSGVFVLDTEADPGLESKADTAEADPSEASVPDSASDANPNAASVVADSDIDLVLAQLFEEDDQDAEFLNFDEVPENSPDDVGHILMFNVFMNRMETLYRHLTNSNIDIELEDVNPVGDDSDHDQQQPVAPVPANPGMRRPRTTLMASA